MARSGFYDAVEAILTGGAKGLSSGLKQEADVKKEIYREQLRNKFRSQMLSENLSKLKQAGYDLEPSGIGTKGEIRYKFGKDKDKEKLTFNEAARKVVAGEMDYDELRDLFPTKDKAISELKASRTLLPKSPEFKETKLISPKALFSKSAAYLNKATKNAISKIKTEKDYQEFVADYEKYTEEFKARGIDLDAINEYFGKI